MRGTALIGAFALALVVGCKDDAQETAPGGKYSLEVAQCKAGTLGACDELKKQCTEGNSEACTALEAAGKPLPGASATAAPSR